MKTFTTFTTLLSGVSLALAQQDVSYTPTVRSDVAALNSNPINANAGAFWIGRATNAVCPTHLAECKAEGQTWIAGATGNNNNFWMAIRNFDGQQVYLSKNGSLEFTQIGTGLTFPDPWCKQNGFEKVDADTWSGDDNADRSPYMKWDGQDWYACQDGIEGQYKVYAQAVVNSTTGADYSYGECHYFHLRLDIHKDGSDGAVDSYY